MHRTFQQSPHLLKIENGFSVDVGQVGIKYLIQSGPWSLLETFSNDLRKRVMLWLLSGLTTLKFTGSGVAAQFLGGRVT